MAQVMGVVALVCIVGSLICWIMVLVKMFKASVGMGILGLLCGIVAFIWGWVKAGELGLKKVMLWWTIFIGVNILANALGAGAMFKELMGGAGG